MPYLPTTTTTSVGGILANQPRIDFTGGGCGSLLLEPSRTNELLYSEYFDGWQLLVVPTVTTNYGISPEGVQNSTRFQTSVGRLTQDIITINNNETFSVYMKGSGTMRIEIGSDNFFPSVTSEWVRYEFKTTQIGGNSSVQIRGNGSPVDVELYGAQYERNSYATSLIPTYGTSVTRASDVCGDAGNSSTFNDSEGVLYAEIAALADDSTQRFITLGDGTNQNEVRMAFENFGTSIISLRVTVGGTQQAFEWKQFLLPSILNYNKIAIVYAENRFELWVNGVKERSSSSGSTFPSSTLDRLDFKLVSGQLFYGKAKQVLTFNTALSDADLTALTTI